MEHQEFSIITDKGHSLSATRFSSSNEIGKTLIISSATGVLQGFYRKFASHFAALGYTVYTFDYHGIGKSGSQIAMLKANKSDLKSWGSNDQAAVVTYATKQEPNNSLVVLTHSVGGQILGFNPRCDQIDKVVLVASQSGYWKYFKGWHYPKMWLLWYAMIPTLTPIFGYFPSKGMGLFENLPRHMVYEWGKWGKQREYMMHFHNEQEYFFDKLDVPLLSWSFPQDHYAPKETVDWLTNQYKNAKVERIHHVPLKGQLNKLKHFGYFREAFKDTLWKKTEEWIQKT
ncbi:MAG: alpha/beta hydrolase family protein [Aurantibacter sp.]